MTLAKRSEIAGKYKWKLSKLYPTNSAWEEDYQKALNLLLKLGKFKGTLAQSSKKLANCLALMVEVFDLTDRLLTYAYRKSDEDTTSSRGQEFRIKGVEFVTKVRVGVSFIEPEIIKISDLDGWINQREIKPYRHHLKKLQKQRAHYLTGQEEEIIANTSLMSRSGKEIYTTLSNADLEFPFVKDENGKKIQLTQSNYGLLRDSKKRSVRQEAFKAFFGTFKKYGNTFSSTLNSHVLAQRVYANLRCYNSVLESSLDKEDIPTDLYENLIKSVRRGLPLLAKYLRLKKKALKIDELHLYDVYAGISLQPDRRIKFEEAAKIVQEAMSPLGSDYVGLLISGFKSGWIDALPSQGKISGAYCAGIFSNHPFVLLNYQEKLRDVFTLAHEMGHALHGEYSRKNQNYLDSEYSVFTAEIASTFNETLLFYYLVERATSRDERIYLITQFLENFRATIFRQVMFAEFEKEVYKHSENGGALTQDYLNGLYLGLNKEYFGKVAKVDREIEAEWAYIPHFYNNFYVYQYATGLAAAIFLAKKVIKEGESAAKGYIEFLKAGGSDYPLNILKKAGVDFSTNKPIEDSLTEFDYWVEELEREVFQITR